VRMSFTILLGLAVALTAGAGCSEERAEASQPAAGGVQEAHAVVLTYHHVADNTPASTSITPAQFDAQLNYLEAQGYAVWPLQRIATTLRSGAPLPDNVVGLSFDDAYASVFANAHPRLQARGWPYTVFVSTEAIDQGAEPYMNWAQLKQLADQGVALGNHSHSHAHLVAQQAEETSQQWRQRVQRDIQTAQQRIRQQTGITPDLFAYPYGEYNQQLSELVSELALIGFGQHSGAIGQHSDFTALPRFPVGGNYTDLNRLATTLNSRPLYVTAQPPGPMVLQPGNPSAERPELDIRIGAGRYNLQLLACYATGQGQMRLTQGTAPGAFRIKPNNALNVGRTKYNCTAPHTSAPGVYYWWSYLLMKPHSDGSWYRG